MTIQLLRPSSAIRRFPIGIMLASQMLALSCSGDPAPAGSNAGSEPQDSVDDTNMPADPALPPGMLAPGEGQGPGGLDGPGEVTPGEMPMGMDPPARGPVWFSDDFESESTENWELTPGTGASFSVVVEPGSTNRALAYTAGSTTDNLIALITDAAWARTETNAGVSPLGDYSVQARIKPQVNGTTGNKQVFLVARYQDAANWYLGGLNVQNDTGATRVEAGYRKASAITRSVQAAREILQGTQGQNDGQWYVVRFDVIGTTLSVYLDGENVGSASDADFASGKVGLFTANKSFLIDDISVSDPSVMPISLVLDPPTLIRTAEAETAPLSIEVRALTSDGVTPDAFTVSSDDESVVSVGVAGTTVTLTPLREGVARVTFTSGAAPGLFKVLTLSVAAPYRDAEGTYPGLALATFPSAGATDVQVDSPISVTFDAPPALGTGSIRIFRAADDAVVDTVTVGADIDVLGPATGTSAGRRRQVNTTPVTVQGNTVSFKPHDGALAYGTEYYVGIAGGALTGTLRGVPFTGLGAEAGYTFTTRAAAPTGTSFRVDDSGTADFRSVQGALDHVMSALDAATPATITIGDGTYRELLFLRGKNNLTLSGESRDGVVIEYENFEGKNPGTGASTATPGATPGGGRSIFLIEASDLLTLDNLTLRNMHRRTGTGDQAETIYFNSDQGRLVATGVTFVSEQDTVQLKGYAWFFDTLIAGNVDFIWGGNRVALFENSEIRTLGDSRNTTPSGGYIVQARTVTAADKGFVFLNSSLTQGPGPAGTTVATGAAAATYLARSGGSATYFDNVSYINCRFDTHITGIGWAASVNGQPAPNPATATAASGWKEFGSMDLAGNPLPVGARTAAARTLTQAEFQAGFANRALIFAAFGNGAGWNPAP